MEVIIVPIEFTEDHLKSIVETSNAIKDHERRLCTLEEERVIMYQIDKNVAVMLERTKDMTEIKQDIKEIQQSQIKDRKDIDNMREDGEDNGNKIDNISNVPNKLLYEIIKCIVLAGVGVLCALLFKQ